MTTDAGTVIVRCFVPRCGWEGKRVDRWKYLYGWPYEPLSEKKRCPRCGCAVRILRNPVANPPPKDS